MRKDVAGVTHLQAGGLWCHYKNKVFVVIESLLLCYLKKEEKTQSCCCLQCWSSASELPLPHLFIDRSIRRMYGMLLCEWKREPRRAWGGAWAAREREAEGLEHSRGCEPQKLRGSFGLLTPLLLLLWIRQTKDSPRCGPLTSLSAQQSHDHTLMECYWNEPYQGAQQALTELAHKSVTKARRIQNSKLRQHPKFLSFLVLFSRVHPCPFPKSGHCW